MKDDLVVHIYIIVYNCTYIHIILYVLYILYIYILYISYIYIYIYIYVYIYIYTYIYVYIYVKKLYWKWISEASVKYVQYEHQNISVGCFSPGQNLQGHNSARQRLVIQTSFEYLFVLLVKTTSVEKYKKNAKNSKTKLKLPKQKIPVNYF